MKVSGRFKSYSSNGSELIDDFTIDAEERLLSIKERLNGIVSDTTLAEIYRHFSTINRLAVHLEIDHIRMVTGSTVRLLDLVISSTIRFSGRLNDLIQDVVPFLQLCMKELRLKVDLGCGEQYLFILNRLQAEITMMSI